MKKQLILLTVALAFIATACGQKEVENPYKAEMAQVEANNEIATRFFTEAWNNGNFAVVDELIPEDALDYSMIPGKPADKGPASFKGIIGMFRASMPDIKLTILDDFGSGDKICHRWVLTGNHTGEPLMGVPASGKEISFSGTTIVRVEDGKIMERWSNVDIFGVAVQLGLVPPPGGGG
jgi:steroid delta-isomerase-like uncharacterized protein